MKMKYTPETKTKCEVNTAFRTLRSHLYSALKHDFSSKLYLEIDRHLLKAQVAAYRMIQEQFPVKEKNTFVFGEIGRSLHVDRESDYRRTDRKRFTTSTRS